MKINVKFFVIILLLSTIKSIMSEPFSFSEIQHIPSFQPKKPSYVAAPDNCPLAYYAFIPKNPKIVLNANRKLFTMLLKTKDCVILINLVTNLSNTKLNAPAWFTFLKPNKKSKTLLLRVKEFMELLNPLRKSKVFRFDIML